MPDESEKPRDPRACHLVYVHTTTEIMDRLDALLIRERKRRNSRKVSRSTLAREAIAEYLDRMERE